MGIRFYCPNGHKLNVKSFQAGRRGICPFCGAKIIIPAQSTRKSGKAERGAQGGAEQEIVLQSAPPEYAAVPDQGAASSPDAMASIRPVTPGIPQAAALPTAIPVGSPIATNAAVPRNLPSAAPLGATFPAPVAAARRAETQPAESLQAQSVPQAAPAGPAAASFPASLPPSAPAGPPDPLAEAGNVVWYVRPPSGGQFGPATSDVMRTWIAEGRVSADSLVWREGWRDWLVAGEVLPQLGSAKNEFGVNVVADPKAAGTTAGGKTHPPRSRRQETLRQVGIITSLVLAVGILVGVFVWVVFYYPT